MKVKELRELLERYQTWAGFDEMEVAICNTKLGDHAERVLNVAPLHTEVGHVLVLDAVVKRPQTYKLTFADTVRENLAYMEDKTGRELVWLGKKIEQVRCSPGYEEFLGRTGTVVETIVDENGVVHCKTDDGVWCPYHLLQLA